MHTEIHKFRGVKSLLAVLCLCCYPLAASEHHGTVTFGGLPLPGATVTATQGDKSFTAVTDPSGAYTFPDLADGVWSIKVEMQTFSPITNDVAVAPDAPSPKWELKLLTLAEMKATIAPPTPAAPAASTATTGTAAAAPAPNSPAAAPAAANGKKPAKGKPGATPVPQQTGGFQKAEVNAAGAGANATPADNIAPVDSAGASDSMVVNGSVSNGIERRTIGNARRGPGSLFRGDINAVLDNSALNANNFSLTGQATPKASQNHLKWGGSFGGPLTIPHLLHGNGQFFLNYQMTRNRNSTNSTTTVPTEAERAGDFSQVLNRLGVVTPVIDPLTITTANPTGTPFAGNVIPVARFSSQAIALLKFYPLPNFTPTAGYNYQSAIKGTTAADDAQGRINRTLTRKDFLNGGFGYHNQRGQSNNIFNFLDGNDNSGLQANVNWRHMFNQRVNSSFGVQYSRYSAETSPFFANRVNVSGEAGIFGNDQTPNNWGPPSLGFSSGIASLSDAQQSLVRNQTIGFTYQGLWVHRPHNITYGFDIRRQQFNNLSQQNARGSFGFNGTATGDDFAGFLLGIPDTSSIAFGNADKYFRAGMYDAYVNDDWRVAAGFTVNIGLRWEYGSPIVEKYGRLVNLDIASGYTAVAPVIGYSPSGSLTGLRYPASLVNPDKHAVQPRLAFSWHPLFGSTIVVRGGYGVYYNTSAYNGIATQMAQQYPLSKTLNVANSLTDPFTLANGFNASPGINPNTFAIDPNYRIGYSQNWQLSVQRDLTEGIVMTATYLGNKGTRQSQVSVPQTYPNDGPNPCPQCPNGYVYMSSNGNSNLESGQLQLIRRFHNGLSANLQYTFSKSIDNTSLLGGRGQGTQVIAQNWLDLNGERALSSFDQRHKVSFQFQYTTGVGVKGGTLMSGWRGTAFKGWTFLNTINAGTGMPLTPIYQTALDGTAFSGTIRPNYTGAPLYAAPPGYFLNLAAFAAPVGTFGNAGRDIITGPAQFTMNSSMARTFHDNIDLRFDATNTLNHVTFPSWNTVINSNQFGLPNPANAMRVVQVTMRWRF